MRIPIESKVLQNVDETALKKENAALENAYITEAASLSRFPHLVEFCNLPTEATVYLNPKEWRGDMIAVAGGRCYRIDNDGEFTDVTKDSIVGSGRVVYAEAERDLLIAAGGDIVRFRGDVTEILSKQAPNSTHVGYIDGYIVALEANSGRFAFSTGEFTKWDPLNIFSAEGKPDDLNSLLVTDFNELILGGDSSMEQFNTSPSGTRPFFRRWLLGDGVLAPYTLTFADNQVWGITQNKEFVSFTSQLGRIKSEDIQAQLEKIKDFTDAWCQELVLNGQRFIVLQIPKAENPYGTMGLTFLYDYMKKRWSSLYGWDSELSLPTLWAGRSIAQAYGEVFIGGEGKIYRLQGYTSDEFINPQRMLWRSGLIRFPDAVRGHINRLFIHAKRGDNSVNDTVPPILSLRVNKNNRGWSKWKRRNFGRAGQKDIVIEFPSLGMADTWQFEIMITDNGQVEISMMDAELGSPAKR